MKKTRLTWFAAAAFCALLPAHAALITNGGFESGFAGWTTADQLGSEGTFSIQTGTTSPVNLTTVPAPPQGLAAAMTDSFGPGSHVLYQDFVVPAGVSSAILQFSLYINNGYFAPQFYVAPHLDFATTALNQQARVDIMTAGSDPFSVAPGDVLQNLYATAASDPLVSGYSDITVDITAVLQAHAGQTLRLRFAEVDNVAPFNLGVDNIGLVATPEPASWVLFSSALVGLALLRRRAR